MTGTENKQKTTKKKKGEKEKEKKGKDSNGGIANLFVWNPEWKSSTNSLYPGIEVLFKDCEPPGSPRLQNKVSLVANLGSFHARLGVDLWCSTFICCKVVLQNRTYRTKSRT